jgi:hypothetical protein
MNRRGPAAEKAPKTLEARKWATPSAVMTLESLSKTLPDDERLTEMRIDGGKVQIADRLAGARDRLALDCCRKGRTVGRVGPAQTRR